MKEPNDIEQDNSMRNLVLFSHLGDVPDEPIFNEEIEADFDLGGES